MPLSHRVATGHDCTNRHWSLVVAPSWHLVAIVRHTVNIFHFCNQMNSRPLAEKGRDTDET